MDFDQFNDMNNMQTMQTQYLDEDSIRLVVLGEASTLSTAILRGSQRSSGSLRNSASVPSRLATMVAEYEEEEDDDESISDPLLKSLIRLKAKLRKDKLVVTDHNYLRPFCDVIKNKDVSGPITGLALQSILKFINYGLIKRYDTAVQMVADSVTKARFIGTDSSSDEVVLMRILNVLHELIVCRFQCLTNNSVCEIMQSCFRIAFEPRLSELLRKSSEQALIDMVQVLFQRITEFPNDDFQSDFKMSGKFQTNQSKKSKNNVNEKSLTNKPNQNKEDIEKENCNQYYGLACIHELLCYLTSLINPLPEAQNSEPMIGVGLTLLTVAFETCIHSIGSKNCLLSTVKNDLCWNIMLLLQNDRPINSFAASLRLAFLIYTNLRMHLKYQFEALICRLMDIITTGNVFFEFREIALEYLVAFFRHLSHLPHELYLNYDCDPYASNLLEDLLQLFSKNCFATSNLSQPNSNTASQVSSFTSMQMLSLDALLANLKSLQKAELCSNDWLNVFPSAIFRTEVIKKSNNVSNEVPLSISPTTEEITIIEPPLPQPVVQPEDVDVGVASSDSGDIPESVMLEEKVTETVSVLPKENVNEKMIAKEFLDEKMHQNYVTYQFPKPEKVPQTLNDIDLQKQRKRLLWAASEHFNTKPTKGIQFLQENHLVNDETEIVSFLRDNPRLDKKQIGEYLSNKKNMKILKAFVESFAFKGLRVDESLRMYLESFRLPGESPLISMILEQFAHHWHESNQCPFENEDAAFSLAYAIIMLNVDQHNTNVKRQTTPMTCEEFISNLRQVNGGKDFDSDMLKETYSVIKTNEIIMPAEQQGIVRERYLWKCLLRKCETENGAYWFMKDRSKPLEQIIKIDQKDLEENDKTFQVRLLTLNGSIFSVLWGPTVAAMTFIFDKINPDQHSGLTKRILNNGFNSCALLCATYGHLDNLIVSLSKFIQSSSNSGSPIMTIKSQLAAQCLFAITREYANEMRESWSNIIELILHWYMARLLDNAFEFEDFALNSRTKLRRRDIKKHNSKNSADAGTTFLSSFYSYFAGSQNEADQTSMESNLASQSERDGNKEVMVKEENVAVKKSLNTYWQPLLLIIEDSKFLHIDSLLELIKALINVHIENSDENDDDIEVFKLEILVQIILMNRDRVSVFWPQVFRYLLRLFRICPTSDYLNERVISAIFRLAIRFVPRPDFLSEQIFLLMSQMLATFEPNMIQRKYSATSLHSFIGVCHSYITKREDWELVFNLLLYIGIGYHKPQLRVVEVEKIENQTDQSLEVKSKSYDDISHIMKSSRGYTSDSEIKQEEKQVTPNIITPFRPFQSGSGSLTSSFKILDLEAYEKCTEILTLLIREILPANEEQCANKQELSSIAQLGVDVLQKYAEASVKIQISPGKSGQLRRSVSQGNFHSRKNKSTNKSRTKTSDNKSRLSRIATAMLSSSESDDDEDINVVDKNADDKSQPKLSSVTETCSLKLLDLMHYLHLNASITIQQGANDVLWTSLWCPLLQGIALFCCDSRRPVRTCALTFLQRALLLHDLKVLSASQWEDCFNKVLFPLLSKLLEPLNMYDPIGMDETRMRTTNLLCKVFLQHLTPLVTLPTFTALWLTILDFMDRYIKAEMQTDYVREAIPESLKNILLVMETAGYFNDSLAAITWDRLAIFLPNLRQELMPQPVVDTQVSSVNQSDMQAHGVNENIDTNNSNQEQLQISQEAQQITECVDQKSTIAATTHSTPPTQLTPNYPPPSSFTPHSTFINIDDNVNPKMFSHHPQSLGFPGSSVIASPLPNATQNASVYFPQPASAYPWPAPK